MSIHHITRYCRRSLAGRSAWLGLLGVLLLATGCRSSRGPTAPLAFLFPTLHSPRILATVVPIPVTSEEVGFLLQRLDLLGDLRRSGLVESELQLLARGLSSRGYAELDARKGEGRIRWLTFRGIHGDSGDSGDSDNSVLLLTIGYWERPANDTARALRRSGITPQESRRADAYGVPQKVVSWSGEGEFSPVLRQILDPITHAPSHWELEYTVPQGAWQVVP